MFICGSRSFSRQDEDKHKAHRSPYPILGRSKRRTSFFKIIGKEKSNKNRFSDRGLDKFYALLADLETKKQKIYKDYTQVGIQDISFVQFVYTNGSDDQAKPIVVRAKKDIKADRTPIGKPIKKSAPNISQLGPQITTVANQKTTAATSVFTEEEVIINEKPPNKRMCLRCKGSFKMDSMGQPYFYLMTIVVLVLVFLAIYGRSFAIFCTSIGWYMWPSSKNVVVDCEGPISPKSANKERLNSTRYNKRKAWS